MKRIIYLNKVKIDGNIPGANFSLNNAYALAEVGVETHLIVQSYNKCLSIEDVYKLYQIEPLFNLVLKVIPARKFFGLKSNQWFYLKSYSYIKKLHKSEKIDAVISRDPGALPYLQKLKKRFNINVFYQPHNFYLDLKIRPDLNSTVARKYYFLERKYLSKMTGVLCLQKQQAQLYQRYLTPQIVHVSQPGLLRINIRNKRKQTSNNHIGYIGSFKLLKGVSTFIQAISILKKSGFLVKVILLGGRDHKEIDPIQKLINEEQLTDVINITGWIKNNADFFQYLHKLSLGVLPLVDNFYNRYLTAPNKLFDYLSVGIPVISSDLPSIREFITDNVEGKLVQPENPQQLADAIRLILFDDELYKKYVQNALNTARKFIWKDQIESKIDLLVGTHSNVPHRDL
jgi:glycosyltransferase involved in cell wall biosynthesis